MKITEIIFEQQQIDELTAAGVGQGIGKAAGSVVRGAGDFFKGMKQGYQAGKAPATGAAAQPNPNSIKTQIAQKKQEIADLEKQLAQPAPGIGQANNQVAGVASNTPEPAPAATPAATEQPPVEPGIGNNQNQLKATASNTPKPAALSPAQIRKQKQDVAAQAAQDQMAANPAPQASSPAPVKKSDQIAAMMNKPYSKTGFGFNPDTGEEFQSQAEKDAYFKANPAGAPASPAAAKPSDAAIKQAQLKKNLQRNQQARAAGQTAPSGFAASGVGQARQRTYAGAGGAPKSYVVRENVGVYSKFLGRDI